MPTGDDKLTLATPIRVRPMDAASMRAARPRLCEILIDAVDHAASVGFLAPLDPALADAYWRRIEKAVADSRSMLLIAADASDIVGTVQIDIDTLPNSPHRATIHKLLVHSATRRRGVGEALMREAERVASEAGRWLLTLDTATPDARRLYERMGWTLTGVIPDYALNPDGTLTDTWVYWKRLPGAEQRARPGNR